MGTIAHMPDSYRHYHSTRDFKRSPEYELMMKISEEKSVHRVMEMAQRLWELPVGKDRDQLYRVIFQRIQQLWGVYQTSMFERNRMTVTRKSRMENLGLESE